MRRLLVLAMLVAGCTSASASGGVGTAGTAGTANASPTSALPAPPSPTRLPSGVYPLPPMASGVSCAGTGGWSLTLHGSVADPRYAWATDEDGRRLDLEWWPGYTARFMPQLVVFDGRGHAVAGEGWIAENRCGASHPGTWLLEAFRQPSGAAAIPTLSPAEAHAELLARAVELRKEFGFPADPAYVEQLLARYELNDYGFPATPEENENMLQRSRWATAYGPIVELVHASPGRFGGLWIDQAHGGGLVVQKTARTTPNDIASVEALVDPAWPPLQWQSVRYTAAEMSDHQVKLRAAFQEAGIFGSLWIDIQANKVTFSADGWRGTAVEALLNEYPDAYEPAART